jgi:TIR domain-containing protein
MNPKVFLSYRRDDSAAYAGRIEDRLRRAFGRNLLFMDVDNIPLGVNFARVAHDEVAKSDVLLALIGRKWLSARDDEGKRRLDNPNDFVRIEISTALRRNIRVIPILLDGATVPKADELPEELKELALRNGLEIRHTSFHTDITRLIRSLKAPYRVQNIKLVCIGCAVGLLVGVLPSVLASVLATGTWLGPSPEPFLKYVWPLYQRAFEWATFISSGAAAAVLRQRYKLPTAVAVSGLLALSVFAIEQLIVRPPIFPGITPAFGEYRFLFYSVMVLFYCPFSYGVFKVYERTSSIFRSLFVVSVIFYFIVALFLTLFMYMVLIGSID